MFYQALYIRHIFSVIITLIIFSSNISGQRIVDKNKGDHNQTRKGYMDGNLAATVYYNFGEIADWENEPSRSGVWPKGTNHTYVDGVAIIVQAETQDPFGNTIHPLESNYYEFTRYDRSTGVTYGWWPLPGYAAPYTSYPARSDDEETWPLTWPDRPSEWNGLWNGFFGKGIKNADVETFFVFDDNEDKEYIINNGFYADAEDHDRGGLGMQVRTRGFQWSQVLAEDAIFWYYEITNMGTTDYEKTLFAQYVDWGIGGHDNSSNNAGDYNELLDMSYAWSTVPTGSPGNWSPVGLAGYAFLESPGKSFDRRDNDLDGLTDESRDNLATTFISSPDMDPYLLDVFRDTTNYNQFYGQPWQPHWDADENGNWRTYLDANENGEWDEGEPLNDDVGTDGIGPYEEGYAGPDLDESEANGIPDQGEPNFGLLDKDESDQLGLTGFAIYPVHRYELDNDEENWEVLAGLPAPHGATLVGVNLANYFSCYLFPMDGRYSYTNNGEVQEAGQTERFSMSMIFGIDRDDLFRRKKTVQQIYNANYRFAKPPDKPIMKAIAGNKKVTLIWDDRAEKTFDAFYQRYNFEGYRIYRSTESNFLESKLITDAYGKAIFRKPIAQFDLVDGVKGLHPIDVNGAKFNLGTDSGMKHSYVDTTVQNGQTYYYAVVAYDKGYTTTTVEGEFEGIPPSETTAIIKRDINGDLQTDINTAVVVPSAPAAGYIAPELTYVNASGPGTGSINISVVDPDSVKDNHHYRIEYEDFKTFHNNAKPFYRIVDLSENDTLINLTQFIDSEVETKLIDGLSIVMINDTSIVLDYENSGWIEGNSNYLPPVGFDSRFANAYKTKQLLYPGDFEIELVEAGQGDLSYPATTFAQPIQSNIVVRNLTDNIDHMQFIFRDLDDDTMFTEGDAIFITFGDSIDQPATSGRDLRISWSFSLIKDTTIAEVNQRHPQIGDIYHFETKKPFRSGEYVEFSTRGKSFDASLATNELDNIAVVPNPYVGAASWEQLGTEVGRGERKIYFTHLPNQCTIRIYSISGKHIQTLEHDTGLLDGQESWNLVSKDGMDLSYGVYVYHVEAPGIGEKIGKFAVIK